MQNNTQDIYLLVDKETNLITNTIIIQDTEIIAYYDAKPYYSGAGIGLEYNPPKVLNPDSDTVEYINDYMTNALEEGINTL